MSNAHLGFISANLKAFHLLTELPCPDKEENKVTASTCLKQRYKKKTINTSSQGSRSTLTREILQNRTRLTFCCCCSLN